MAKLKIVTDSSATMKSSLRDQYDIHIIPLSVMIDGTVYTDDESLTGERFMEMMAKAKKLPKTSQPPIGEFVNLYDKLGADGSEVLSIHMSDTLSGTVDAARQASNITKSKVTVIDTKTTDQSLAFAVIRAAQLAQEGKTSEEVLPEIQQMLQNTKLYIGVSTLENLVKGGRISRAKGLLSSILSMRVIMEFKNGDLFPIIKGRGTKTFNKWFERLKSELKNNSTVKKIGISYAGGKEQCEKYKNELQELFPQLEIYLLHTTPIIATHTGKDAFAIMYYAEQAQ
ncbi:DegV family protein [Tetragenococcus koreensis]|uniref:DegV family protein n=1 Tax=Tetragenococcus koreensis TaxID=290335 RepID=UPI001F4334B5|nr:DegV family protein [Tetragenococcus koreensis]MCF1585475.1 DegV family protein [Tetragenococcus koreensis]MCF1615033.1 DegV family protein [Tetragenococcus koreensis]MCF1620185.1 DegV family protein [Tetragenococcus koreensis]MCF1624849.1 DegV family protein [Tetragenococcus koreensis]MCF1629753.1 DegV family protein [Tetragenococcus koreensis]